ncbi:choice-of-anchor L domain-containing protein, partial [Flavobacterium sp. AJR]|uniref:choice-of-anchor L domain-containing protein n=1 Tax=Flavobacterium sp. AJR TaxID=1979369 RepID=UPI000F4D95C5
MRNFTYFKLLMPNKEGALNRFLVCFLFLFIFGNTGYSQVQTTHSAGPNDTTILNRLNGSGVILSVPTLVKGDRAKQIAIFSGGTPAGLGIDKGILFSTGLATADLSTRNTALGVSNNAMGSSTIDPDLATLDASANNDAVVYTFKVTLDPKMTAIRIFFQFGSEEYPDYVGSRYNDVFGFFISGPGVTGTQNIAKLPSSNREISVNSVNGGVLGASKDNTGTPITDRFQTDYYINNGHSNTGALNNGIGPRPVFVEYNGLTKRISYDLTQLTPGATYNFKIAIADVGDSQYDSGVFVDVITASYGADLSVKKEVVGTPKKVGDEATFLITASNAGPYGATGVKVNDLLPSGYTFVSATPSAGTYDPVTGIWNIGVLANRGNATLTVKGILKAKGDYNNIAKITGNEEDPDPLNNESSSEPVKPPVANNDSGNTIGGTAVTIAVTTNDTDPDGTINVATVDLDPLTPGIQATFTVADEGTYTVDASGIVTFTPLTTFSGVASLNYVVNDNDGFTSNEATITVTVKTKPPTASAQTFCSADLKIITDLPATGNEIKWYDSLTGGILYDATHVLGTRTYYASQTINGNESTRTAVAVTINSAPVAPVVKVEDNCDGTSKLSTTAAGTLLWSNGETTSSIIVNTAGTYTVTTTVNGCTNSGSGIAAPKNAPAEPTATTQTFCSAEAKKVGDLQATGTAIQWYSAATNGTLYSVTDILASGTYYASQTIDGCESARTAVVVKITPTPAEPTATTQTFCSAEAKKVADLQATGTAIQWYSAATNGTLYSVTDVLASGTYYASQTIDGCESARTAVVVKITPTPAEPTATTQTFCSAEAKKVGDLQATGAAIHWYSAATNGTLYSVTDVLASGTYYASQTIDGCESARTAVVVKITPTPAEPTATTQTFCSAEAKKVGDLQATGTAIQWYSASTNGTLYSVTDVLTSGTYYASQTIDGCESARTAVVVNVNTTPAQPRLGTLTKPTCSISTGSIVLNGLPSGNWTINPGNISGNTTTTTVTGLVQGNSYSFTVTSDAGCISLPSSNITIDYVICAITETTSPINGNTGGKTPPLTSNDKLNGVDVVIGTNPGEVKLTPVTVPTGLTLNPDGTVTISPNTPAGNYDVTYKICEVTNPTNCDEVTSVVVVSPPLIEA